MTRLGFAEFRRNLEDTLKRVALQGERVVIHRRDKDIAAVVSVEDLELLERFEDRLDIEAAERALADPANETPISWGP